MATTIYNQIDSNKKRTFLVMILFSLFFISVFYIFAKALGEGFTLLGLGLIFVGVMNFLSYYNSDKIVLAVSGAKQITKNENLPLFRIVENLSIAAGIKVPKIYLIVDTAPNAFATGRDPQHASIAVTKGLLEKLEKLELEGVIAHELSHIRNFDTRLMAVVSILVGIVALISDWFLRITWWGGGRGNRENNQGTALFFFIALIAAILAPIIGLLIQLAISRRREFLADASSALLTRYPDGLASALLKIAQDKEPLEVANRATAHLYITNPLKDQSAVSWFAKAFSTHPSVEERVVALRAM